jgi:hypothetical protein
MSHRLIRIGGLVAVIGGPVLIAMGLLIVYFLPSAIERFETEYEDALILGFLFLSTLPPGVTISWIGIVLLRKRFLHSWEIRIANILLILYIVWYSVISLFAIFTETTVPTRDQWLSIPWVFIFGIILLAVRRKDGGGNRVLSGQSLP